MEKLSRETIDKIGKKLGLTKEKAEQITDKLFKLGCIATPFIRRVK